MTLDPSAHDDPVRGRIRQAIDYSRRHAWIAGMALWASAGTVLTIHWTGLALPDPARFAMFETWLVGIGSYSLLLPTRCLGRRLARPACMLASTFCLALALMLTGLIIGGALRGDAVDKAFAVIMPVAAFIITANEAATERRAAGREEAAGRKGRQEALAELVTQSRTALAGLSNLEAMTVGELQSLSDTVDTLIEEKYQETPALHLLPAPPARRSLPKPTRAVPASRYAPSDRHRI